MKKILVLLFLFMAFWGRAQSGISYQAVLMSPTAGQLPGADNPKSPLVNATICLRFSISPSVGGTPEYQETITASTDGFGMVNVVIGAVNPSSFAAISWVTGTKYLKVELDHTGLCTGSNTFSGVSEQPFTTVPFALYALNSGSGGGGGSSTTTLTGDVSGSGTGSVATTITNNAVTTAKIANSSVTNAKLQNSSITINGNTIPLGGTATIASSPIGSALASSKILVGDATGVAKDVNMGGDVSINNLGTTTITNAAVNFTKIQDVNTDKVLGNFSGTTGSVQELATTGSGDVVRATSPTLVTPVLGVATASSMNKVVITAPTSGATLTITDGKTLTATDNATVSNTNTGDQTITLTGDVMGSGTGSFTTTVGKINGTSLAGLATGILKNTTSTGIPSIAVATDFPILNQNTTGTANNVTGVVAITNGGTGSATQNFVDLINDQTVAGNKIFSGNTSIGGTLNAGATTLSSTLGVTGATNLNDNLTIVGTTTATDINATNINASGTLGVTGLTSTAGINDTGLIAANNITAAGTLGVTGLTSTAGINDTGLIAANNITAAGNLGVTGNTTLNGNLTVSDGITDIFKVDKTTGITTVNGNLNTSLNSTIGGTLGVTLATTIGGPTKINSVQESTATSNGALTVDGGVGIAKNLNVGGTLKVNKIEVINSVINTTGTTTINAISGRFRILSSTDNTIVTNNKVNSSSIIICTIAKNSDLTRYYIVDAIASTNSFKVTINGTPGIGDFVDINFLVIN